MMKHFQFRVTSSTGDKKEIPLGGIGMTQICLKFINSHPLVCFITDSQS